MFEYCGNCDNKECNYILDIEEVLKTKFKLIKCPDKARIGKRNCGNQPKEIDLLLESIEKKEIYAFEIKDLPIEKYNDIESNIDDILNILSKHLNNLKDNKVLYVKLEKNITFNNCKDKLVDFINASIQNRAYSNEFEYDYLKVFFGDKTIEYEEVMNETENDKDILNENYYGATILSAIHNINNIPVIIDYPTYIRKELDKLLPDYDLIKSTIIEFVNKSIPKFDKYDKHKKVLYFNVKFSQLLEEILYDFPLELVINNIDYMFSDILSDMEINSNIDNIIFSFSFKDNIYSYVLKHSD